MITHKGTVDLETPRLLLRKFAHQDCAAMYRNWASDPEVTRFLTWPIHETEAVTSQILSNWINRYDSPEFYQWAIVGKEIGDPIGSISAVHLNDIVGSVEIGYCLGKAYWHQGIMTEALGAVIEYMIDVVGLNRVEARHDPNNPHSGGVMRKCGMRYEGTLRQVSRNNQGLCDLCCYGILASDREG